MTIYQAILTENSRKLQQFVQYPSIFQNALLYRSLNAKTIEPTGYRHCKFKNARQSCQKDLKKNIEKQSAMMGDGHCSAQCKKFK